jgi:hypothetical protein
MVSKKNKAKVSDMLQDKNFVFGPQPVLSLTGLV